MREPVEFTVIVPAHNEEAVIGRCLASILDGAPADHRIQIIVAANGCTDQTAEAARKAAPEAIVVEIAEGSKPKAMNAAASVARHYPRIYLDADIQCNYRSLHALAEVLQRPGVMAASPAIRLDLSRCSSLIKAYYKVWMTQPYVTDNMVGSGCYGLSQAAAERIGPFPIIIGDDIWVHSRFAKHERASVKRDAEGQPVFFTVSPPTRVIDQIRVETRRRLGNLELRRLHPSPHYSGSNKPADLPLALKGGARIWEIAAYLTIKALARLRSEWARRRSKTIAWERDLLARQG